MSLGDFSARYKKKSEEKNAATAPPPLDYGELHTLRARILGVLLQDARRSKGLTEAQCAAQASVPVEYYQQWELGQEAPTLPQLEILAYYIGIPVSHFWSNKVIGDERQVAREEFNDLRDRVIGTLIRLKRNEYSMSEIDLALACGLQEGDIFDYEMARRPIPFTELTTIASALKVSVNYFMDDSSRVGEWLNSQEAYRKFDEMPPELREWVLRPSNQPFIEIAMRLSKLPVQELREVGENILNITL